MTLWLQAPTADSDSIVQCLRFADLIAPSAELNAAIGWTM
jgi:hypothetical protein